MKCICIGNPERNSLPENAHILLRYVVMSLALCPEPVSFYCSRANYFEKTAHNLLKKLSMEFLPFLLDTPLDSAEPDPLNQSEVVICYVTEEETTFYPWLSKWEKEGKHVINLANEAKPTLHRFIANRFVTIPLTHPMKWDFKM